MSQQQIIASLQAVKRTGVNLGNVSQVLAVVIDALIYVVQNTPGQLRDARGTPITHEAGK